MQKRINLIPLEMAVPARAVKLARLLSKISIVGTILLIISTIYVILAIVIYSVEYKKVVTSIESKKIKIVSLEKSEQKLFLAKDRTEKIVQVINLASAHKEIDKFRAFSDQMTTNPDSSFTEVSINTKKTELSISSKNSNSLTEVLKLASSIPGYKNIVLSSFGFSPATGFLSNLIFNIN